MRGLFPAPARSSRSPRAPTPAGSGASHYCASKAGVVMFTRVLAMELAAQRINVNCIAPGCIKVEQRDVAADFRLRDRAHQEHPVGAVGHAGGHRAGRAVPGVTGGRLRDRRGARRQRRSFRRAHVPVAQRPKSRATNDGNRRTPRVTRVRGISCPGFLFDTRFSSSTPECPRTAPAAALRLDCGQGVRTGRQARACAALRRATDGSSPA